MGKSVFKMEGGRKEKLSEMRGLMCQKNMKSVNVFSDIHKLFLDLKTV